MGFHVDDSWNHISFFEGGLWVFILRGSRVAWLANFYWVPQLQLVLEWRCFFGFPAGNYRKKQVSECLHVWRGVFQMNETTVDGTREILRPWFEFYPHHVTHVEFPANLLAAVINRYHCLNPVGWWPYFNCGWTLGMAYHIQFSSWMGSSCAIYLLKATPHDLQELHFKTSEDFFLENSFFRQVIAKISLESQPPLRKMVLPFLILINPYYKQWCLDVGLYGYPLQLHVFARGTPHQDVDDDRGEGRFLLKATPTLNLTNMPQPENSSKKTSKLFYIPSLKLTFSHLKMDGWKTSSISFWGV